MTPEQTHANKNATKEDAQTRFIGLKLAIDEKLSRLQALSDSHFDVDPERVGWDNVAELMYYHELLADLSDKVFKKGEYR